MKKKIITVVLLAICCGAAAFGYRMIRDYEREKFDKQLVSPESVIEACLSSLEDGESTFHLDASIYNHIRTRKKDAGLLSERIITKYNQNLILQQAGSRDSFGAVAGTAMAVMSECEFSEPEKIIQIYEDEVYYRIKAATGEFNQQLWICLNQAASGLWYISEFSYKSPYDWTGNEPLTEKNKQFAELLAETITDEEIYRMFAALSATQLRGETAGTGFANPARLSWQEYLDFMFASMDPERLAAAYDQEQQCYRFPAEEIGRYVWNYLGWDEYENNAFHRYGYGQERYEIEDYLSETDETEVYVFSKELVDSVITYDSTGMQVIDKQVLENGRVRFEISYQEPGSAALLNTQQIEVRAMENGYRYISYYINEPGRESEGNRTINGFVNQPWNLAIAIHFDYQDNEEELKHQKQIMSSDFDAMNESLKHLTVGAEMDLNDLPETAEITDAWTIEAHNGRQRRMLEVYSLKDDSGSFLLLRNYALALTAGSSGGA